MDVLKIVLNNKFTAPFAMSTKFRDTIPRTIKENNKMDFILSFNVSWDVQRRSTLDQFRSACAP